MLKKYFIPIFMILSFLAVSLSAQEAAEYTQEQKNIGIIQIKDAVSKLKQNMTRAEVEEILGKATSKTKRENDVYMFDGGEWMEISYYILVSGKIESSEVKVVNKYGIDLLQLMSSDYCYLPVFNFPIFLDGKELLLSNQSLRLNGKISESSTTENIYLSDKDIENIFGTKISWDKEANKQLMSRPIYTQYYIDGLAMYALNIVDVPVFVDGEELIMANPILVDNDTLYLSVEEISERFKIKLQYNRHNNRKPTNTFDEKYEAIATDATILIDGKDFLTFNPIVTIDGKIYLPADEVEEILGIRVYFYAKNELLEIKTGVKDGFKPAINYDTLKQFKEGLVKLRDGTQVDGGIEQVLGERYESSSDWIRSSPTPARYRHKELGTFAVLYGSLLNKDNINLLALKFNGKTVSFPAFLDGKEIVISSPIVTLDYSSKIYLPIVDLAKYLNIKVDWNEEKAELNITTTQEKK